MLFNILLMQFAELTLEFHQFYIYTMHFIYIEQINQSVIIMCW